MKFPIAIAAILIALAIGCGAGYYVALDSKGSPAPERTAEDDDLPDPLQASRELTADLHRENDDLKDKVKELEGEVETLKNAEPSNATDSSTEIDDLKTKFSKEKAARIAAETERDDLKAKLEAAETPETETVKTSKSYVDWGKYSEIEGLRDANWKELGETYSEMNELLKDLTEKMKEGKQPSAADSVKIQETNQKLVQHYIKFMGKVGSEFQANGDFTHPYNLVNILAGQLDTAGKPLSDSQLSELKTLAEEYDNKWEKAEKGFNDGTWKLERMKAEAELKEWFKAEMFRVTTPEQKEIALPPSLDGLVRFDLYSAGLNLMTIIQPLTDVDQEGVRKQLKAAIVAATSLTEEQLEGANYILDQWIFAVQDIMGPFTDAELGLYHVDNVLKAMDAQLVALKSLHNDIANTDEERASIAAQQAIAFMRLKKTD
ncbi:MAG: hypothetical protein ACYTDT_02965 [Planctomycetota bacterium]|jgi:hypothetical protein